MAADGNQDDPTCTTSREPLHIFQEDFKDSLPSSSI
ncbi:hypothetical protein SLEP1_g13294 [Rubroshorea leprosula]|uniref:Uncharacterized protein n=1 Tax=Rubroshorea leprosula TaxID=152421 RepID=A0AAV5IQR1_9ROSI|nr:hypothetical protein SLEP1_g13294 [Rubroshorea leprosula]